MGFNWEDENSNNDTFMDMPDEVNEGQSAPMPVIHSGNVRPSQPKQLVQEPAGPTDEEFLESVMTEEEQEADLESVLADANLRIELATLYKLVMNHDFFEGMDVDQRAIDTVHKEMRKFARERLEIMLGMRAEPTKTAIVSSPFNDLEVVVLKKLASTYSKGATATKQAEQAVIPEAKPVPRREGLNKIQTPPRATSPAKKTTQALLAKPQTPVQRQPKPQAPLSSLRDEENYKPIGKPLHEMTEQEIIQRNKEASERQASRRPAKSSSAIPMPTPDQEEMFQTQRVMNSDHPLSNPNAVSAIISALNKSKSQ